MLYKKEYYIYAAMGNNPGMMIDPNGTVTKEALEDTEFSSQVEAKKAYILGSNLLRSLNSPNYGTNDPLNTIDGTGGGGNAVDLVSHGEWDIDDFDFYLEVRPEKVDVSESLHQELSEGFWNGVIGGFENTLDGIRSSFTVEGYINNIKNAFFPGIELAEGVVHIAQNIPNYNSNDYAYGAGFLTEKVVEALVLRKVSQANVCWSGFSRNASGNLKFSLKAHWPNDNFMIRLERGHRSPWSNTTTPYFGQQYNGFNTHLNIQKFGSFNYHVPLNPFKWKYYAP